MLKIKFKFLVHFKNSKRSKTQNSTVLVTQETTKIIIFTGKVIPNCEHFGEGMCGDILK